MDWMLYPTFTIVSGRGIIPCIRLPRNFRDLVPVFYREGRKDNIGRYVDELQKVFSGGSYSPDVKLNWDDTLGLRNISVDVHGGLDLSLDGWPSFQEHNLGGQNGFVAASIAMEYISELLKSEE